MKRAAPHRLDRLLALAVIGACVGSPIARAAPTDGARLSAELGASDSSRRARAARELAALDPQTARPLVRRALEDLDVEVRVAATIAAGQLELLDVAQLLLDRASSPEPRLREATIEALGRLRPSAENEARPIELALIRALTDSELTVRAVALRGLADRRLTQTGRAHAVEAISATLSDERPELRRSAAEALEAIADPIAVHALAARTDDASPEVRFAVVRALGAIGDARSAPAVARLVDDKAEEVRGAAISTLGLLGDATSTARLAQILERPRDPLAGVAALALGRIVAHGGTSDDAMAKTLRSRAADELVEAVRRGDNRGAAIEGLRATSTHAATILGPLLPALGARPLDEVLLLAGEIAAAGDADMTALLLDRARAATDARFDAALIAARPKPGPVRADLVEWLAARLGDPGAISRRAAATALGALGDPRAASALEAALSDGDSDVRRAALLALASTSAAPEPLLLSTAKGKDGELAHVALAALARRHDDPARHALADAIGGSDATAQGIAAFGLSDDAGATSVIPALLSTLKLGSSSAKAAAVLALLGPLRHRANAAASELCFALATTDELAAPGAVELLGAMRDPANAARLVALLPKLGRHPARRARVYAALGDLLGAGASVEGTLVAALDDTDAATRASAAWALGKSTHASDALQKALVTHLADASPSVRANALGALARLGRTPPAELLARLSHDREPALVANAVRLGASVGSGRARSAVPPLVARAQATKGKSLARGTDYLLIRTTAGRATAARIGLPDGLVEVLGVDERGLLRDDGVAAGDLIVDADDTLLR